MNLLILMPEIVWGGAERQFRYLIENINVSEIFVVCPHMYRNELTNVGKNNALLHREVTLDEADSPCKGKIKTVMFYLKKIKMLLQNEKISVTIVYDAYGCYTIPYLKMKGVKVIYAERNSGEGVVKGRILKKCISIVDAITTNSSEAEKMMKSYFSQPIYFIKNGIEETLPLNPSKRVQTIVVPARIAKVKNQKVVLQFLLNFDGFSGKVIFAGKIDDEDYYSSLLKFIDEYKLQDRVEFKGFISDMEELYRKTDLVILPSYVEGMSNIILECFMRKIPIIVSNIPMNMITENLRENSFSPDSYEELEEVFLRWNSLSADERALRLDENRNYVLSEYSIKKMTEAYQSIIEEME